MEAIDALVLAKLAASHAPVDARAVAVDLELSSGDLARSLLRLKAAGVYGGLGISPARTLDFFEHALKYLVPPRVGRRETLGIPTCADVAPLDELFVASASPWVWPAAEVGDTMGRPLRPIHPLVIDLVDGHQSLHLVLACADCFRVGDARERNAARSLLSALLRRNSSLQRRRSA